MEWNVLAVGDVVAGCGVTMIETHLPRLRKQVKADFTVVNGENAAILGITREQAETILDAGADVITMGNHTFGRREICPFLDDCPRILRPANLAPQLPGRGWGVFDSPMGEVTVIDLIGRCHMDYNPDNPFLQVDKILRQVKTTFILVEIHAEATSEKLAMGRMLDGQVSAVWGHAHPCAHRRQPDPAEAHGLCHGSGDDGSQKLHFGHPPRPVRGPVPGRSGGALSARPRPRQAGGRGLYPGRNRPVPEHAAGERL